MYKKHAVIPAKAGIQHYFMRLPILDAGSSPAWRENLGLLSFYMKIPVSICWCC